MDYDDDYNLKVIYLAVILGVFGKQVTLIFLRIWEKLQITVGQFSPKF